MNEATLEGFLALEWVQTCEDKLKKQGVYSVKAWTEYWEEVETQCPPASSIVVLKRALSYLPRSYKLWKTLWEFMIRKQQEPDDIVSCFERALLTLSAFPRVWIEYLLYLCTSTTVHPTLLRRVYSRSLASVAVTQHGKLWAVAREWLLDDDSRLPVPSIHSLWHRFCLFQPDVRADYAVFCERFQQWGPAAKIYHELVLDSTTLDADNQTYWKSFGDLVSQHPREVSDAGVDWENILKRKSSSRDAALWQAAAWIRMGDVDQARTVYESAMQSVKLVKDFTVLYAAYLQLEEGLLEHLHESIKDEEGNYDEKDPNDNPGEATWDVLFTQSAGSRLATMELTLARAEHLTTRRPILLNSVQLRQNPENVEAWLERANLLPPRSAAAALETALESMQRPSYKLVNKLIELYDPSQVRSLMDRVCRGSGERRWEKRDLVECWAAWLEFELQEEAWDEALSLSRQCLSKLPRSVRLWDLRLDLEESLGTVQTTKDAYRRVLETKVATVNHVLQFTSFLKDHRYFEEAFAAYEIGVELFAFPHAGARVLWKSYLTDFLHRFSGSKIERTRHLFQRCLTDCPTAECIEFFLMNGEFEEKYGLTQRALSVYRDMCEHVGEKEKYSAYELYVTKTRTHLGVPATRQIYEEALAKLGDEGNVVVRLCQDFAMAEVEMDQVERARAIFTYGAQFADQRVVPEFWKDWNDFEIVHGNEDSFREMLRVKRSTETAFSAVNFNAMGMTEHVDNFTDEEAMRIIASGEGVDLDESNQDVATQATVVGFVTSKKRDVATIDDIEERMVKLRKATTASTEDQDENEIDLEEDHGLT